MLDPVRVYQDFAQLDLVSHGRAEIIAGRSAFAEPFALFGAPMNEYDELFAVRSHTTPSNQLITRRPRVRIPPPP